MFEFNEKGDEFQLYARIGKLEYMTQIDEYTVRFKVN